MPTTNIWECKARVKQVPLKPTEKRPTKWDGFQLPGPNQYTPPPTVGGNGYSKIRRAPAYTFGLQIPVLPPKPAAAPNAPVLNIRGFHRKGCDKILQGIIAEKFGLSGNKLNVPGPGAYSPKDQVKKPPAYSITQPAKPPYQSWDMWTPSPNMYCPPIMAKKQPAYSFGDTYKNLKPMQIPGPGEHNPNFDYNKRTKPAFSFGHRHRKLPAFKTPAPNTYSDKKYNYRLPRPPARSFGIKHSPYLGKQAVFEKPSKLELIGRDLS